MLAWRCRNWPIIALIALYDGCDRIGFHRHMGMNAVAAQIAVHHPARREGGPKQGERLRGLPPFTRETAIAKVRMAEDGWSSRDPHRVSLAYTEDSRWRNRAEFI